MSRKINVLVVDDSPSLRKVISNALKKVEGVTTFEAENGSVAEEVLQEQEINGEPIEVVFLDWIMPQMTGLGFLQRIRAVPQFAENPKVIMLTAETYPEQIEACMRNGVTEYIVKPFSTEQIQAALSRVVEQIALKKGA